MVVGESDASQRCRSYFLLTQADGFQSLHRSRRRGGVGCEGGSGLLKGEMINNVPVC